MGVWLVKRGGSARNSLETADLPKPRQCGGSLASRWRFLPDFAGAASEELVRNSTEPHGAP